jgi:signal transduction histidine kinase
MHPPGANALLSVTISDDAEFLSVTLADTGRGLPEGTTDRIFEPDFTSKAGGTGLGLAVARQIVRAHGGEIAARSPGTGGAQFVIRLPRMAEDVVA